MSHRGHRFHIQVTEGMGGWSSFATLWCETCWIVEGNLAAREALPLVPKLVAAIRTQMPHVAVEFGL